MDKNIKDYLHLYLGCYWQSGDERHSVLLTVDNIYSKSYSGYKPILRSLSDMTDEELQAYEDIETMIDKENVENTLSVHEAKRTLFLISKHFDLFGLIEAGLAIDKTTLK